jgi:hypothetical protein
VKRCSKCGATKALDRFHVRWRAKDGRASWCKDCFNAYARNNPPTRERNRANYQSRKLRNPDGNWQNHLKYAHGMHPEDWFAMWKRQAGRCYLCDQALPEDRGKVHIDHDHSCCGKDRSCGRCRRGLAHRICNTLLGWLETFGDVAAIRLALVPFLANYEREQARVQALMADAPRQDDLFGDTA